MADQEQFSVTPHGDYVHLVTRGPLKIETLEAPAQAALALAKKENIHKLLDDIRYVDNAGISIPIQAKGVGVLWKLREFDKVAVLLKDKDLSKMFFSTLEVTHLSSKFRGFYDEAEAVAWLQSKD